MRRLAGKGVVSNSVDYQIQDDWRGQMSSQVAMTVRFKTTGSGKTTVMEVKKA